MDLAQCSAADPATQPAPPWAGRSSAPPDAVALAVWQGLRAVAKRLPPWMLYDQAGAAIFEEITALPEYYLTRTERSILASGATGIMAAAGAPAVVIELGAGSASKTELLLEALLAQRARALYVPVDVSPALPEVAAELRGRFPRLAVTPVSARYPEQLDWMEELTGRRLVVFLGSSIGNYDRVEAAALLRAVRRRLGRGDGLLLGTDLVKPEEVLLPAYDDPAGVTARFNKNLLTRINRELGGAFDLESFRHHVRWNPRDSRMELYLESLTHQLVPVEGLGLTVPFAEGELIHTENSHKFTMPSVRRLLEEADFRLERTWTDPRRWFALHLARV